MDRRRFQARPEWGLLQTKLLVLAPDLALALALDLDLDLDCGHLEDWNQDVEQVLSLQTFGCQCYESGVQIQQQLVGRPQRQHTLEVIQTGKHLPSTGSAGFVANSWPANEEI